MSNLTTDVKVPELAKVSAVRYMKNYVELLSSPNATTRTCSEDGCDAGARYTKGYYLVKDRRVRVWVCTEHYYTSNPSTVLPTPASIVAALKADDEFCEARAKHALLNSEPERSVSVKVLVSTGFGSALPFDRVAAFRWEPTPKSIKEKYGKD